MKNMGTMLYRTAQLPVDPAQAARAINPQAARQPSSADMQNNPNQQLFGRPLTAAEQMNVIYRRPITAEEKRGLVERAARALFKAREKINALRMMNTPDDIEKKESAAVALALAEAEVVDLERELDAAINA